MVSDDELVRRCKEGNPKYQALFYQKFAPMLMGICMRYARNVEDAQDLLHDSFVKIFTNIESVREDGSLDGWVRRITVNTAINAYHKKNRIPPAIEVDDVQEWIPDERIEMNDFLSEEMLLQFIQKLPDGYRTIFNLFEIDGYSHLDIAKMTGGTYSTVRSQLFKAKRALKLKIEKYLSTEMKDLINKNNK